MCILRFLCHYYKCDLYYYYYYDNYYYYMIFQVPDGIRFHTVAVYLVELKSVANDQVKKSFECSIKMLTALITLILGTHALQRKEHKKTSDV